MIGVSLGWFLTLIDRLIALATATKHREQAVFREVVAPTFVNLRAVATDYFSLYAHVTERLLAFQEQTDPVVYLQQIIADVRVRRIELLPLRREIASMARTIRRHARDRQLSEFAGHVEDFFIGDEAKHGKNIGSSRASGLIRVLDRELDNAIWNVERQQIELRYVAESIEANSRAMEYRWEHLTALFAELQYKNAIGMAA